MLRAIFAGVSGLRNQQTKIDVISNNIANVNTTGYKSSRVSFHNQFSQTIRGASSPDSTRGGTNPAQVGLGTTIGGVDSIMTQGTIQTTGKNTDLAISGEGFFMVSDGNETYYTRDGNFDFDRNGSLANPNSGMKVLGWPAELDDAGNPVINTMNPISPIEIPMGKIMPPRKTTKITVDGNVDSLTPRARVALSGVVIDSGVPDPTDIKFNDQFGNSHTVTLTYDRPDPANPSQLRYTVTSAEANVTVATDPLHDWSTGLINFNANGNPVQPMPTDFKLAITRDSFNGDTPPSYELQVPIDVSNLTQSNLGSPSLLAEYKESNNGSPNYVVMGAKVIDGLGNSHNINIKATHTTPTTWRLNLSFNDVTISKVDHLTGGAYQTDILGGDSGKEYFPVDLRFDASSGKIISGSRPSYRISFENAGTADLALDLEQLTSLVGENTAIADQDGYASGILQGFNIDGAGIVSGAFSNGESQQLAEIALATFNNPAGLSKLTDNTFAKTNNSGEPAIGGAKTGERGSIQSGSLEMSNVDLAASFSEMIIAQRAFQSNSRLISISDEILQEMINLKR